MRFAKMPEVSRKCAEPRSTLYWRISCGTFVPPIKQGERAAAFDLDEVEALMRARAAGASTDEVRALVRGLVAARQGALHAPANAAQHADAHDHDHGGGAQQAAETRARATVKPKRKAVPAKPLAAKPTPRTGKSSPPSRRRRGRRA